MKNRNTNDAASDQTQTVSLGAHVSKASRDKLATYQKENGFHNVHDALNTLLSELPDPEPVKPEEPEPDPNQTTLPGCEE